MVKEHLPITKGPEENGNGLRAQRHCTIIDGGIGHPSGFLALHFLVEEDDDSVEKLGTMGGYVVGQPLIEIEVFSTRCQGSDIKSEHEGANFEKRF
jgi:hypothetical protein